MIKKIFLGALVIIVAKCWSPSTSTTTTGPIANTNPTINANNNKGEQVLMTANAAVKAPYEVKDFNKINGDPIMANNVATNTMVNSKLNLNFGKQITKNKFGILNA